MSSVSRLGGFLPQPNEGLSDTRMGFRIPALFASTGRLVSRFETRSSRTPPIGGSLFVCLASRQEPLDKKGIFHPVTAKSVKVACTE